MYRDVYHFEKKRRNTGSTVQVSPNYKIKTQGYKIFTMECFFNYGHFNLPRAYFKDLNLNMNLKI